MAHLHSAEGLFQRVVGAMALIIQAHQIVTIIECSIAEDEAVAVLLNGAGCFPKWDLFLQCILGDKDQWDAIFHGVDHSIFKLIGELGMNQIVVVGFTDLRMGYGDSGLCGEHWKQD